MNIQEHKNTVKSLSVCSIPVMLAVAGWSAGSSPSAAPVTTAQTHCESVPAAAKSTSATERYIDVAAQRNASWFCLSPDKEYFWVAKGADATISIYRFVDDAGNFELVEQTNPADYDDLMVSVTPGESVDLQISDDGEYLHQVFVETGKVGVYEIEDGSLSLVEVLVA